MSSTPRQAPPLLSPEPAVRGRDQRSLWVLLILVSAVALTLEVRHFWPFITDDAYISLRYSQRLLQGHGLTWNDLPPRVEGYTNLLWVLLCAVLGAIGMNLETAAHLLGIVSTIAVLSAVAAQVYRDFPAKLRFVSALVPCLALCCSAPIAVWAIGGLEQPLLSAFVAWAAFFALRWISASRGNPRDADIAGLLLGFAVLTRADGALFTALFFAGAVLADGIRVRSLLTRVRITLIPAVVFLGQELFRHAYYGEWVPNTAYVKVAFTLHRLSTGLKYDMRCTGANAVFFVLALIGAVALWIGGKRRQVIFLATASIGWLLYILVIGGDIFPAARHFVPSMALMGFLIAGCGLLTLSAPFRFSRIRVALFLGLALLTLTSNLFSPVETWEREGKSIGLFLRTAFGAQHPLLVSDAAGVVPFYSQLESIDPLGLNDYHIARHFAVYRGHGFVGHELGDGAYVLDHKPDLLLLSDFHSTIALAADRELEQDPRFAMYQLIHFDASTPYPYRAGIFIRRVDGKLGIEQTGDKVTIPAYLAKLNDANAVRLIDSHAELVIAPQGTASFTGIPASQGCWIPSLAGAGTPHLSIGSDGNASTGNSCLQPGRDGTVSLTVHNQGDAPATLAQVLLDRKRS